ncbi:MAG: MAPEG family protein [Gammaproteobacteria bacterium]|nr:MAPEG family protein [Gammaproteobacteria bacterium]
MTMELTYLLYVAMLTAALWIPYVISQVTTNGFLKPANYTDPTPRPVPLWGQRAHRTYLNAVETFAPFAALVLIIHLTDKASAMTAYWCAGFFWMRLIHAVVYLLGVSYIRTLVFTLGFFCEVGLFWEIIK